MTATELDLIIVISMLAAFVSSVGAVVALNAATAARKARDAALRDRHLVNRTAVYNPGRTLR